jgi:transketolase
MISAQPNREMYGKTLVEMGESNPRLIVFEADIAKSTNTFRFQHRFPDRFFQAGTAELNMVCMAAGAAATGYLPFVSTFVVFLSMRAVEGIRTSIAYPRLNVKIVATNAGVEICGDGVTHQGIEDLAIMRAIPNMTVLSPADPVTTRLATLAAAAWEGPVYMRLGRQTASVIYPEDVRFEIGRMIRHRDGRDVTVIATGHMVEQAILASDALQRQGVSARVLDCHTVKPIDVESICSAAVETAGIVTVEDHNIVGGLGGAVCEVVAEHCPTTVRRVGLRDRFASSGREASKLLGHYDICRQAIEREAMLVLDSRAAKRER